MEPSIKKKTYSRISEKHYQTSINLTNVFNFIRLIFELRWVWWNQMVSAFMDELHIDFRSQYVISS